MRQIPYWLAALAMAALAWSADTPAPAQKKPPAGKSASGKKSTHRSTARKKSVTSATSKKPGTATVASRRGKASTSRTTWRNRQMAPTPERYKEIQEALVAKGYLKPEQATGNWDAASADALKKFQSGQSLEPSGKVNSLSLIALGLGPKHEAPAPPPAKPPAPPAPDPPGAAGH